MKKAQSALCAILSAIFLIMIPFSLIATASDGDAPDICVISDVHFKHASIEKGTNAATDETELYFRAGIQGQMDYESNAIVKSFMSEFSESDSDILLVAGDITDGNIKNHREIAEMFSALEALGKKVFVINGNHDITDESRNGYTSPDAFAEIYEDFGYSEALSRDESSLSYTAELGDGYRLIAIDSCIYGEDSGRITDETMSWIDNQFAQAKNDGVTLVAMMHHSLLSHMSCYSLTGMQIEDCDRFAKKLAENGVSLIFTGHFHANDITEAHSDGGKKIYDVMTGSLITYPNAYRQVSFTNDKVNITTSYVESVDVNDLPDCFSDREKSLINGDFREYAKGFLYAGIENWINSYLGSSRKICKLLNIERDSELGKKLDEMMPYIAEAMTMPLYGESNSLEAIASLSGNAIPKSDYKSISEIAGAIFCGIYSGDETIGQNSIEVKVLSNAIHAAIVYAVCGMSGQLENDKVVAKASEISYASAVADDIVVQLAAPVINGITCDAYAPGDLNVSLDVNESGIFQFDSAPISFLQYMIKLVKNLFEIFGVAYF